MTRFLQPPASKKEAEQLYLGRRVRKYFEPDQEQGFEGGWFDGEVVRVDTNVKTGSRLYKNPLYLVRYSDGDQEDLTFQMLTEVLVDDGSDRTPTAAAAAAVAAAARGSGGGAAPEEQEEGEEEVIDLVDEDLDDGAAENENGGFPQGRAHHRSGGRGLGDITNRRSHQLTLTNGLELRSKRPAKRKVHDDYEYDEEYDVKAAKKAAAAGPGPSRAGSKFGIRGPSTQGAAGLAAPAALTSESSEEVPLVEGQREVGLPGHLQKIELIDFMCHEHFTMEFGPHVTFISGCNGSGKSAVLQALQMCLGVKANQTGRAPNFKAFIRTGCDEAIVRVTLHNKPYKDYDAFQHHLYGDTITVERRIARVGTASVYLLKDAVGRIHGRRRDDLDAMLATLSINAANPVTVMTQDTARSFLSGSSKSSDREKWDLYMDATSLSQIRYNLEVSKSQIRLMDESVAKIKAEYEAMQAEHAALHKSIEALRGLEAWRVEIGQYEQVLAWAIVDEHLGAAAALEQQLAAAVPGQLAAAEGRAADLQAQYAALRQGLDEKEEFLRCYTDKAQALAAEAEGLKGQKAEAHKSLGRARGKLSALERRLAEERGRKEALMTAVQEASTQLAADAQAITAEYTHALEAADEEHKRVDAKARAAAQAKERAEAEHRAAEDAVSAIQGNQRTNSSQIKRTQESMSQLQQVSSDALAKFGGREMVALVRLVKQQAGRFHKPPIGPLGSHLVLCDNKWARAVEAAVGLHLNAFLASDLHDCRLLQELLNRAGFGNNNRRPLVAAVKFDLPAYTIPASKQPDGRVLTVLRALSCSHPRHAHVIMNYLVDSAKIEQTALGASREECQALGFDTPNVAACFGPDGSKYYKRGRNQNALGPPFWMKSQPLRLGGDSVQEQMRELREDLQRLQQEAAALAAELEGARQALAAAADDMRCARRAHADLRSEQFKAKQSLDTLMSQPPPEVAATQAAVGGEGEEDEVQRDILEATQAVLDLEQQLSDKQAEVEAAAAAEAAAAEAWHAKKAEIDRLNEENQQFVGCYQDDCQQLATVVGGF